MDKIKQLDNLQELNDIGKGLAEAIKRQHETLNEIAELLKKLMVLEEKLLNDIKQNE